MRILSRRAGVFVVSAAVVALSAACSSPGDGASPPAEGSSSGVDAASSSVAAAVTTADVTVVATDAPNVGSPTTASDGRDEPIATVVDGVPGIDSDDPFCRAWSRFAGSFQVLAFVSTVGGDPQSATRLEVIASTAVLDAVAALDRSFPGEIVNERAVFVDDMLGPFARRAERSRDALRASGLDDDDMAVLSTLWLDSLAAPGVVEGELSVEVPAALEPRLDEAVAAVRASVPPIGDDPSLINDASAPTTLWYIAANCPDQGTLGGYDVID